LDIKTASDLLSELNLKFIMENYEVEVKHFRVDNLKFGMPVNRHMHSNFEYHIISSGRSRVIVDSGSFEVSEGEFYITGPGVYHEQIALSSGGYVEYSLCFDIKSIDDIESETKDLVDLLTITKCKPFKDSQNITKTFEQALFEAYHRNIGFYGIIKSLVSTIIIHSARAISRDNRDIKPLASIYKDNDFRILQLERFIEDNMAINLTTEDISRYMALSGRQVCRIIKEKTGKSTKDFMSSLKLQKSKELLETSDFSLKHISNSLGFESEVYFNQWFKKKEGIAPGSYRESKTKLLSTL
jgi:AraC-like DNA-binding protein